MRDTDVETACGHSREGEDGTNWDSSTDIYAPPCVKQLAQGKLLCNTGISAQRCDDPEGWDEAVGGRFQREEIYVDIWLTHRVYSWN